MCDCWEGTRALLSLRVVWFLRLGNTEIRLLSATVEEIGKFMITV